MDELLTEPTIVVAIIAIMVVLFVAEVIVQASTKTPVTNNVVNEITREAVRQVGEGNVKLPNRLSGLKGFEVVPRPQVSFSPASPARPVDGDGYVTEHAEE